MSRNATEVNNLLSRLADIRDKMDTDNADIAARMNADADIDDNDADNLEVEVQAVRVMADTQRNGAGEIQKQQMRIGSRQADLRRKRATNLRMNAYRLRSLAHATEKANAKEI